MRSDSGADDRTASLPKRQVLHLSDVHLGFGRTLEFFTEAQERLACAIAEHGYDLIVISGDLFDSNRVDRKIVRDVAWRLSRLGCQIVIIPGNHDAFVQGSVYEEACWFEVAPAVRVIREEAGETLHLDGIRVWGRPVIQHDVTNRPFAGIPAKTDSVWNIALAHGQFVRPGASRVYASPIWPYEIEAAGYDYVALGHAHAYQDVSQPGANARYCGAAFGPLLDDPRMRGLSVTLMPSPSGLQITPHLI